MVLLTVQRCYLLFCFASVTIEAVIALDGDTLVTLEGKSAARRAAQAEMAMRGWNYVDLRQAAGIDAGTVADFLSGDRWPKLRTQGRIEAAFDWPPGTLTAIADGQPAPSRPNDPHSGLSPAEQGIMKLRNISEVERQVLLALLRGLRSSGSGSSDEAVDRERTEN